MQTQRLVIPPGTYTVSQIQLSGPTWNGKVIEFAQGATLVMKTNYTNGEHLLSLNEVSDFVIQGPGALQFQTASPGEQSHDLSLFGCTNVLVRDLRLGASAGDGLYIGRGLVHRNPSVNCEARGLTISGSKRNGISVTSQSAGFRVIQCDIGGIGWDSTMGGTSPMAGIDVEPDHGDTCDSVLLIDCHIHDCRSHGFLNQGFNNILGPVSISLVNTLVERCDNGITLAHYVPRTNAPLVFTARGLDIRECASRILNLGLLGKGNKIDIQGTAVNTTNTCRGILFNQDVAEVARWGIDSPPEITVTLVMSGNYRYLYTGYGSVTNISLKGGCTFNIDNRQAKTTDPLTYVFLPDEQNEWLNFTMPVVEDRTQKRLNQ